jgi:hypothetical protein
VDQSEFLTPDELAKLSKLAESNSILTLIIEFGQVMNIQQEMIFLRLASEERFAKRKQLMELSDDLMKQQARQYEVLKSFLQDN